MCLWPTSWMTAILLRRVLTYFVVVHRNNSENFLEVWMNEWMNEWFNQLINQSSSLIIIKSKEINALPSIPKGEHFIQSRIPHIVKSFCAGLVDLFAKPRSQYRTQLRRRLLYSQLDCSYLSYPIRALVCHPNHISILSLCVLLVSFFLGTQSAS